MKRWAAMSVVFLILAVAVAAGLSYVFSPAFLSADLARAVEASSGKQIRFQSGPRIALWPEFGIAYGNVSLTEKGASGMEPFAEVEQMRVKISPAALISRRAAIDEIRLLNPRVNLQIDKFGRDNWSISAPPGEAEGKDSKAAIPPIYVEGGTVNLADLRSGQRFSFSKLDMLVVLESPRGAVDIRGSGDWRNDRVSFSLFIKSPQALAGKGSPIDVNLSGSWLDFGFSGRAAVADQLDLAGTIQGGSRSLRGLMRWAGVEIGAGKGLGNFRTSGAFHLKGKALELSKAQFRLDGAAAKGEASLILDEGKPALAAKLDIEQLDLNDYFLLHQQEDQNAQGIERWAADPVDFTLLNSVQAKVLLRTERLIYGQATTGNAVIDALLENGILNAKVKDIQFYGGRGEGQLVLNGKQRVPTVQLGFDVKGVDARSFLDDVSGFNKLDGASDLSVAVAATGRSPREMIASLRGTAGLQISNGTVEGINVPLLMNNVAQKIVVGWQEKQGISNSFNLLKGNFKIADGIAESSDLELTSPRFSLKGEGLIDLLKREVEIKVQPASEADAGTTALAVPMIISGPWEKPKFYPDIAGVLENPTAAYDALKALIRRVKKAKEEPEGAPTANNAGGVAGEALSSDSGSKEPPRSVDLKKQLNTNTIELMNGFAGEAPPEPVSSEQ
jgi:AsmA protein